MTLKELRAWFNEWLDDYYDELHAEDELTPEVANAVLAALATPTQEQMERVLGGSWQGSADGYADGELVYDMWTCSRCGYEIDEEDDPDMLPDFCPKCGAANTDKAREIIKKKWEALNDGKGD